MTEGTKKISKDIHGMVSDHVTKILELVLLDSLLHMWERKYHNCMGLKFYLLIQYVSVLLRQ